MRHERRVIIPPETAFRDARGELQQLFSAPLTSVLRMTSVRGAIRGNHYHHTDYHYCWLQRGRMIYAHRPVGSRRPPREWLITPGQVFYTPPQYEHVMYFLEPSVVLVFARNQRAMAAYEADTVRIPPLTVRRRR